MEKRKIKKKTKYFCAFLISCFGLFLFLLPQFSFAAAPVVAEITTTPQRMTTPTDYFVRYEDNKITAIITDVDGNANGSRVNITIYSGGSPVPVVARMPMHCSLDRGSLLVCYFWVTPGVFPPNVTWGNEAVIYVEAYDFANNRSSVESIDVSVLQTERPVVSITSGNLITHSRNEIRAQITDADGDADSLGVWLYVTSIRRREVNGQRMDCLGSGSSLNCSYFVTPDCGWGQAVEIFVRAHDQENNVGWSAKIVNVINPNSVEINCSNGIDDDCDGLIDRTDPDCPLGPPVGPCSLHNVFGYGWSENIGWLSMSCRNCDSDGDGLSDGTPAGCPLASTPLADYGVDIDPVSGNISGYAWSENIGWVDFSPDGPYPAEPNYSAQVDLVTSGEVSGWAKVVSNSEWLKFKGLALDGSSYGVKVSNDQRFRGWAWGDTVVGWLSFNCQNCDFDGDGISDGGVPGGSGGPGGPGGPGDSVCPPAGTPIEPYVTETTIPIDLVEVGNQAPDKPSFPLEYPGGESLEYCNFSDINQVADGVSVILHWTYSDPESDVQTASEIRLDQEPAFLGAKFNIVLESASTDYGLALTQDQESDWLSQLQWNTAYYWKVRVRDSFGNWSEWSDVNSFTLPVHARPRPNFIWQPNNPQIGQEVAFTGSTIFSGSNPASRSWQWNFGDGGSSSQQNPSHIYPSLSGRRYTITLKSCDEVGCCSASKKILVGQPGTGGWIEVKPIEFERPEDE